MSQRTQKYVLKISEKSHFKIRRYALPSPGGAVENFHMGAQFPIYNCIKSWFKSVLDVPVFGVYKLKLTPTLSATCSHGTFNIYISMVSYSYKDLVKFYS